MQYMVFKIVPLDWSLPVIIFNICISYQIIVLNRLLSMSSGDQVLEILNIYKEIYDTLQVVKKYFDILYMLALLMTAPELIFMTYLGLLQFKGLGKPDESIPGYVVRMVYNIEIFMVTSLPAVSAGLVTSAVEDLKLILLDRLLRERNKAHEQDLKMFLQYVTWRPMRFTLFKVVPLDWTLPVIILNVCITYQIIIVQFTNLYYFF
ncbi:hypothetical protein ABMA28_008515 [Loxostege sticticalis]|uniref:Gustatory receptor n=1 Tax=Loxostege sticticalis TaxID=481309 RepID=A0ABD0SHG0_LOXSC